MSSNCEESLHGTIHWVTHGRFEVKVIGIGSVLDMLVLIQQNDCLILYFYVGK